MIQQNVQQSQRPEFEHLNTRNNPDTRSLDKSDRASNGGDARQYPPICANFRRQ